jgi:hypothetical protein
MLLLSQPCISHSCLFLYRTEISVFLSNLISKKELQRSGKAGSAGTEKKQGRKEYGTDFAGYPEN